MVAVQQMSRLYEPATRSVVPAGADSLAARDRPALTHFSRGLSSAALARCALHSSSLSRSSSRAKRKGQGRASRRKRSRRGSRGDGMSDSAVIVEGTPSPNVIAETPAADRSGRTVSDNLGLSQASRDLFGAKKPDDGGQGPNI